MKTTQEIKGRMAKAFAELCQGLNIKPIDSSLGARSSASFDARHDAEVLWVALRDQGAPGVMLDGSDAEGDEWQVSWGEMPRESEKSG
jgi:hypothetical protein